MNSLIIKFTNNFRLKTSYDDGLKMFLDSLNVNSYNPKDVEVFNAYSGLPWPEYQLYKGYEIE